jgi:hypothetical protein
MPKATIKSQTGAVITIEGTQEEVSKIISDYEKTTVVTQAKSTGSKEHVKKRQDKKRLAASDLIIEMKDDGFFDKPKSLIEISQALEEKGRMTPVTSLSGLMIKLVQERFFARKKVDGKWVYAK